MLTAGASGTRSYGHSIRKRNFHADKAISEETMQYGLIGEKLSHSYSPQIHRAFFEITGITGEYKLFELQKHELQAFLNCSLQQGFRGLNVTIPYKSEVIPFMKQISPEAAKIGAVNTILLKGSLKGFNTDYFGIDYTLRKNRIQLSNIKALILGSGGAAKAVAAYLLDSGIISLFIACRNPAATQEKFPSAQAISYDEIENYHPFHLVINTTPVGMAPKPGVSPITSDQLKGTGFLFDLIYNPGQTELMKTADRMGIPSVNGLYMLVAQAVKAQEIWNEEGYGLDMVDAILRRMDEGLR